MQVVAAQPCTLAAPVKKVGDGQLLSPLLLELQENNNIKPIKLFHKEPMLNNMLKGMFQAYHELELWLSPQMPTVPLRETTVVTAAFVTICTISFPLAHLLGTLTAFSLQVGTEYSIKQGLISIIVQTMLSTGWFYGYD